MLLPAPLPFGPISEKSNDVTSVRPMAAIGDTAFPRTYVQRSSEVGAPGLVMIITAVAYHFCPSLPAAFAQPGDFSRSL